jgi:hypothetical protein
MSAVDYLKRLDNEWNRLAVWNANGRLVVASDRKRFLKLIEMRKRAGKKWQK